jgi:hypothetical protein
MFEPEYVIDFDLPEAMQPDKGPKTIDPTIFLAGLIKIMWVQLATLWRNHLDIIHQTAETKTSPITQAAATIRIHTLQAYKDQVEATLRTPIYFPADIDAFLDKSSLQQLQNYIEQYSPVIMTSLNRHQEASRVPPPPPSEEPAPQRDDPTSTSSPTTPSNTASQHPALEEAQHRKRNRRRKPSAMTGSLPP